jgi:hypothetical protein
MKRMWMAAAVVAAVSAGSARADFGGPMPPPMPTAYPGGMYGEGDPGCKERFGLHPLFKKAVWWKKDCGDAGCGKAGGHFGGKGHHGGMFGGKGGCGPGGCPGGYGGGMWNGVPGSGMPGSPGAQRPGTLVFPHHWYARSPRDFFMYEAPRR